MGKRVNIAIGTIVAAGLLLFIVMNLWLSTLVRTAIVATVSRITKTPVSLEDIHIGPLRGLVQLDGLEIGNPPGFVATRAARLGTARVRLDVGTALSDTVVIDEILVDSLDVTYEGIPTSNLSVIQGNVAAAVPAGSSKPAEARTATPGSKKFLVKKFSLLHCRVVTNVSGRRLPLNFPDIHLTDIGKETGGATPDEIVSAVFTALSRSATDTVTVEAKQMGGAVSKAEEGLKKLFK